MSNIFLHLRRPNRILIAVTVTVSATLAPVLADEAGNVGPDVTVIYLNSVSHYTDGTEPGMHAYSVGTTSCNVGDEPVWWCDDEGSGVCDADGDGQPDVGPEMHPVIGQNLYRLRDGRFEQIGMSWLKHGFFAVNGTDPACGPSCQDPPSGRIRGDQLGVGCTDPYSSVLNGHRPLGLRSEVNSSTGQFPFPYTVVSSPSDLDQRIRVEQNDLDPAQNPGAKYWVEGQYVAPDDAQEGNGLNNASYRQVTVDPDYDLSLVGQNSDTVREMPAIYAWRAEDPSVEVLAVEVPETRPTEWFQAARRIGNGLEVPQGVFHYEYAIRNHNSDRAARSLLITFPGPVTISDAGFRDVDHHSGEPYATTDWNITIDEAAGTIEWSTDTFNTDPNANALRWGTMFTFWFDADLPPNGQTHTLGLFKPGSNASVSIDFVDGGLIFSDNFESGDTSYWIVSE